MSMTTTCTPVGVRHDQVPHTFGSSICWNLSCALTWRLFQWYSCLSSTSVKHDLTDDDDDAVPMRSGRVRVLHGNIQNDATNLRIIPERTDLVAAYDKVVTTRNLLPRRMAQSF